jgi:hypothetical protein
LFLNLHVHHLICSAAVCDPIFIDNRQGAISIELANFVNQIKEDYTTARYIFALSQYKNARFKKINDGVVYASPPNAQSAFSIEDGLMKTSFEEAYSILDKIAAFLNDYYSLNLKFKIYFTGKPPKGFWEKDSGVLRIELLDTKNPSLYALYDIYKDFEDDYKILTDIRNGLAHRKLVITDLGGEASPLAAGKPIEMISPEQMLSETMQLFHVVKSAVIYLINAINLEPRLTKRP